MLWITLIRLWNGANLSMYEHVTQFVSNTRHKAFHDFVSKSIQSFGNHVIFGWPSPQNVYVCMPLLHSQASFLSKNLFKYLLSVRVSTSDWHITWTKFGGTFDSVSNSIKNTSKRLRYQAKKSVYVGFCQVQTPDLTSFLDSNFHRLIRFQYENYSL